MERKPRVVLIGGTSNLGKTTVAQLLAQKLAAKNVSTDKLARHPGRPWQRRPFVVPAHVAEHYLTLNHDELIASVLKHYQSMWPTIEALVRKHVEDQSLEPLVLEGSALLPESVTTLKLRTVSAVWLTGSDDLIQTRIHGESGHRDADGPPQLLN